jgi:hypothetical protein
MRWMYAGLAVCMLAAGIGAVAPAAAQDTCVHGENETPAQAARRQQAVRLSRQINTAQAQGFRSAARSYRPLEQLPGVTIPEGFEVKLAADANGYAFSVIDQTDPCKFGYFSNEAGLIYTGQPLR